MIETMPTIPMVKVQYNVPKAIHMPRSDFPGKKASAPQSQIIRSGKILEKLAKERRKSK